MAELMPLADAVAFVPHGATVALEGFTHLIPFAAGHEVIRQHRRQLPSSASPDGGGIASSPPWPGSCAGGAGYGLAVMCVGVGQGHAVVIDA